MEQQALDTKPYLEYLDKEMSIMGILSAVSVLAPGGILSSVLASDKGVTRSIWDFGGLFIVAGSALCVVAALLFYKQRSRLAWFYGRICFCDAMEGSYAPSLRRWIEDADSWATWWPYDVGFTFLIVGFAQYFFTAFAYVALPGWSWLSIHIRAAEVFFSLASAAGLILAAPLQWYVLTRYPNSDHYWISFRSDLFGRRPR